MKRILQILLLLCCTVGVAAAERTVTEAIALAEAFKHSRLTEVSRVSGRSLSENEYTLVYTVNKTGKDDAALYVVQAGNSDGFVIVSADDCAETILGYSDEGAFNADDMPAAMRMWLDLYAEQIAWAESRQYRAGIGTRGETDEKIEPVKALLSGVRWGQDKPYNSMCPKMAGANCPSGCVATAISQIMFYWKYPTCGYGSYSYEWLNPVTQKTRILSADFGETEYDWDNILKDYSGNYSKEQGDAVAKLLFHVGVACNMNYNYDGSGSYSMQYVPTALFNHFGYKPTTCFFLNNGVDVFKRVLINELQNARPVYLSGSSASAGGHAFLCDGVDEDGMFHINWGWNGSNTGYYAITALNPGKYTASNGFNSNVSAICNIMPDYNMEYVHADSLDIVASRFIMNNPDTTTVSKTLSFCADSVVNLGYANVGKCVYRLAIFNSNDSVVATYGDNDMSNTFYSGLVFVDYTNLNEFDFSINDINDRLNSPLPDGEYYIKLCLDLNLKFANPIDVRIQSGPDRYPFTLSGKKVVFHDYGTTGVTRIGDSEPSVGKYYLNGRVIIRKGNSYYDVYGIPVVLGMDFNE